MVMTKRQTNVPLTDVVANLAEGFGKQDAISPDAVGLVLATTAMAYELPIASTEDAKVKVVVDFSDVVEQSCTKAGF